MTHKLLITSFQTWLPHQSENSSDVLLEATKAKLSSDCILLRKLPVDFVAAPQLVLQAVQQNRPRAVVACGMAEGRSPLTVEQFARRDGKTLETSLPLTKLIEGLSHTKISEDAGDFVCNGLYFDLLAATDKATVPPHKLPLEEAVFVHVPLLTDENQGAIAADFIQFLKRLNQFLNSFPNS
ncbi:MAG: peptidase C15 [Cyanobacteria bacterium P01_F01_bin.153]